MKKGKVAGWIVIAGFSFGLFGFIGDDIFKINKAYELFSAVFQAVSENYVLDLDPEKLVQNGIEGMLASLDPYTEFYPANDNDEINVVTNGKYIGFGFTIGFPDSNLTIVGLNEGSSAYNQGIRIGDRILQVDSNYVLNINPDELKKYTKGVPGTTAHFKVLRDGLKDTLDFTLTRDNISLKNISYFGIYKDGIGYIKLDRFTRTSHIDVKQAIAQLKNDGMTSGIIIDLRDNPGGLLTAAVSICELFVPKGSLIVSTMARTENSAVYFRSISEPIEPTIPLAILINENSASASEIVAGAIQDLDRGVVIGRRSFGKDLVQNVLDLPYQNTLKITTAKYYTPSGRCIQRLEIAEGYRKSEIKNSSDTLIFHTKNGRKVYELTGIQPDTTIENIKLPELFKDYGFKRILFKFGNSFASKFDSLPENFKVDDKVFSNFEDFFIKQNDKKSTMGKKLLGDMDDYLIKSNYSAKVSKSLKDLTKAIENDERRLLRENKSFVSKALYLEICERFYPERKIIEKYLPEDRVMQAATNILSSRNYGVILSGNTVEKNN